MESPVVAEAARILNTFRQGTHRPKLAEYTARLNDLNTRRDRSPGTNLVEPSQVLSEQDYKEQCEYWYHEYNRTTDDGEGIIKKDNRLLAQYKAVLRAERLKAGRPMVEVVDPDEVKALFSENTDPQNFFLQKEKQEAMRLRAIVDAAERRRKRAEGK